MMTQSTSEPPKSPPGDGPPPANHFALKALVIGLGVLMVAMMIAVIVGIILTASGDGDAPPASQPMALQLPANATVIDVDLSDRHLAVRYTTGSGAIMVDLYDPATGRLLRRFLIAASPSATTE